MEVYTHPFSTEAVDLQWGISIWTLTQCRQHHLPIEPGLDVHSINQNRDSNTNRNATAKVLWLKQEIYFKG